MRLPSGYGSVVKLSGNRRKPYAVRVTDSWTDEGRQKYKYLSYHISQADALKALAAYNNDPEHYDREKVTYADVYRKWSAKAFEGVDPKNRNRGDLERNFARTEGLHNLRITTIKTDRLQVTLDALGLKYSAASKVKVLWVQMWAWAHQNDIVDRNYASYVKIPQSNKSELHKPFTDAEIDLMWSKLDEYPNLDYVLITCYAGWRPSELLDLKIADIDLAERTMKGGSKTTAGKGRVVPIHKRILPLIESRIQAAKGEVLFYTERGKPMRYASLNTRYWPEMMQPLGLEHKPHDGRHTCTSNLDRKGANDKSIKLIIGHESEDFTKRVYTHKVIEDLIEAIDLLD